MENLNVSPSNEIELYFQKEQGFGVTVANEATYLDRAYFGDFLINHLGHETYFVLDSPNNFFTKVLIVDYDPTIKAVFIPALHILPSLLTDEEIESLVSFSSQPPNSRVILSEIYASEDFSITINQVVKDEI